MTVTAATPAAANVATISSISSAVSSATTRPWWSSRADTSSTRLRGTSGASFWSRKLKALGICERPISSTPRLPRETTRPSLAPRRWMMALSASVVP